MLCSLPNYHETLVLNGVRRLIRLFVPVVSYGVSTNTPDDFCLDFVADLGFSCLAEGKSGHQALRQGVRQLKAKWELIVAR